LTPAPAPWPTSTTVQTAIIYPTGGIVREDFDQFESVASKIETDGGVEFSKAAAA
jgi:hypothetical protein